MTDQWQSIDSAPRDGSSILVWHDHDSEPYWNDERLTAYGAWCEGGAVGYRNKPGVFIAYWGGGYSENHFEYGTETMPDWWFEFDDGEGTGKVVAPTHWMPLPQPPTP